MTSEQALEEIKRVCGACPRHTDPAVLTCAQGTCEAIIGFDAALDPKARPQAQTPAGGPPGPAAGSNTASTQYEVRNKKDMQFWLKPIRHCLRCKFTDCSMTGVHREVRCAFYEGV